MAKYRIPSVSESVDVSLADFDVEEIRSYLRHIGDRPEDHMATFEQDVERVWRLLAEGNVSEAADLLRRTFKFLRPFEAEKRIADCYRAKSKDITHVAHA